jgi:GT2 family glycosyltransferase
MLLSLNNDTEIPPWFYRELLACDVPFVTGVTSTNRVEVAMPPVRSLTDGPDFSAFLIRRSAWEAIGPFDESMVHYCSDVDYDIRARKLGITLLQLPCEVLP